MRAAFEVLPLIAHLDSMSNGSGPRAVRETGPVIVRALSIAGSDPSGGAGIQADLKSFAAHGAYGMAAIASLTAQNTRGVRGVFSPPAEFLAEQLDAISDDIMVDTVKIGMLGNAGNIAVVARLADRAPAAVRGARPGDGGHQRRPAAGSGRRAGDHATAAAGRRDHPEPRRTGGPGR